MSERTSTKKGVPARLDGNSPVLTIIQYYRNLESLTIRTHRQMRTLPTFSFLRVLRVVAADCWRTFKAIGKEKPKDRRG
jgi:hypothetical protein